MTDMTHAERRERALVVLEEFMGAAGAETFAAGLESDLGALGSFGIDWTMGDVWGRPGLAARDRALIILSQLATLGQLPQLGLHTGWALDRGLEETEIEEVFVQLCGYAGFPRAINAMQAAHEVFRERRGGTLPPRAPAPRKSDAERRTAARAVLARLGANQPSEGLSSGGRLDAGMGAFTGTAGRWAFGELWSREELTPRERSLVVVATLVAQGKPDELRFHLRGALNHGASPTELEELLITSIVYVGFPSAVEGMRVLREVEAQGEG